LAVANGGISLIIACVAARSHDPSRLSVE